MKIAEMEMCEDVQVDAVLEVKAYACPPWVARPKVVIYEDEEQARAIVEEYKPGQVDIYVDASVRKGKTGIGVYAMPSRARIAKTVASSDQVDTRLTELLAISEASNWPWGLSCMARDRDGAPAPAPSIRIFSDAQSALQSIRS
ncbi:uncharacterized protein BDZ99DRAFT_523153 [Mytilinidion resinicola]|uniref:Uncharacterized protein n=1 Tax=Mytilinidion resinicola TaxID=574789 RepID=A0A6A6YI05_9PEZI|nr:uncharacterized protein BDZ99DRAFT_523153 [Mytilinidion resinicola]KAF2807547.1 hypothetical protein BDZ99DRAFT_523153 [Mytilinidion resinicola]